MSTTASASPVRVRKIAFLDHTLDNWHANTFRDLLAREGAALQCQLHAAASLIPGKEWADAAHIHYTEDVRELKGEVDGVMVLAPSNPEVHLKLVEAAVELGVPLYVDKAFAPDVAIAQEIFALADRASLPIFSSSALRFADELTCLREWNDAGELLHMQAYGGGSNFPEYAIHPLEMLISVMGAEVCGWDHRRMGDGHQVVIEFERGRIGTLLYHPGHPGFRVIGARKGELSHQAVTSPIFPNLMRQIASFFQTGAEPVRRAETLKIIDLLTKITQ